MSDQIGTSLPDWVQSQGTSCRPCFLAPLASMYRDALEAKGHSDLAKQLLDVAEADVATIATEMDAVRQKVCEIDTATCDELTELTLAMMEAEAEAIPEEPTPG